MLLLARGGRALRPYDPPAPDTFTGTYLTEMVSLPDLGAGTIREVVVPDGTYQIGSIASLAMTNIVHTGKLRLVAESMHGVKIVRAAQSGTSVENWQRTHAIFTNVTNVEFIGFHFEDILMYLEGCAGIKFWYCIGEYDPATHPGGAGQAASPYSLGKSASAFVLTTNGGTRCNGVEFYGVDVPIVGDDVMRVTGSNNVKVIGCDMTGTDDASKSVGADPTLLGGSEYHDDAFQSLGSCNAFEMSYCSVARSVIICEASQRSFTGTFDNCWFRESASFGMHVGIKTDAHSTATISVTRTNCWSNGHFFEGGSPTALYPTGMIVSTATNDNQIPSQASPFRGTTTPASAGITVSQPGILITAPAQHPYLTWRAANPYASWATILGT